MFLRRLSRLRESSVPFVLALSAAAVTLLLMTFDIGRSIELLSYDARCQLRKERSPGNDVFLLVVDEGFLQSGLFGMFPWPRKVWAEIQREFVNPLEPKTIVYDILFDQPDKRSSSEESDSLDSSDAQFAETIEQSGNVLLAASFLMPSLSPVSATQSREYDPNWRPPSPRFRSAFALDKKNVAPGEYYHGTSMIRPLQDFERAAAGIGHTNTPADGADKITRRFPLIIEYCGDYYPSMPLVAVCKYLGSDLKSVRVTEDRRIVIPRKGQSPLYVPIDEHANLLLNYYGKYISVFPSLSMAHFLQALTPGGIERPEENKPADMRGKILLIGSSAASTYDLRPATLNELYPLVGNVATAVDNVLQEDFLEISGRSIDIFILLLVTMLFADLAQRTHKRIQPFLLYLPSGRLRFTVVFLSHFVPALALSVIYGFVSYYALAHFKYVIPLFYVIFCIWITLIMLATYSFVTEEQNKRWYEQTWGRYMSPKMIQQLRSNPEQLNIGGEEREITLLFTDIKGFTSLSENLSPTEVVELLNEYFETMVTILLENNGMLDKYMGDALMVHFGSPQKAPDDALRAVRTALQMQEKTVALCKKWVEQGRNPFQIRVGVNTGTVVVGNIGSAMRQEYTAIGDNVNVAQRLEANCPPGGVLISKSTYEHVKDSVLAEVQKPLQVKNRKEPVEVYLVKGLR